MRATITITRIRLAHFEHIFERLMKIPTLDVPSDSAALIGRIQSITSRFFGVSQLDLVGHCRSDNLVWPRFVAIRLCHDLTGLSQNSIAHHFGDRHQGTISNALATLQNRLDTDPQFARDFARLKLKAARLLPLTKQS